MQQSYATEDHVGCQHGWIRIVFVVIYDEANDEDAAAGVVAAAVPDDAANRMCHVLGTTTDDAIYAIARTTTTLNAPKITKEQYDCYFIDVWKTNMFVILLIH